eukprot:CAMPEP_0119271228 /NCGR_PEP_ID=MMETSP1329-20130426/7907_1 /TAXON_ID=114041 /ORGANISM="Genus nov. species nov., Strain RCC1024" /LENGTH=279 /DNA_ID=CAMNT_0007271273 /DNA_START=115 /DNA_END=951 /DNA_ORIENTATION=-
MAPKKKADASEDAPAAKAAKTEPAGGPRARRVDVLYASEAYLAINKPFDTRLDRARDGSDEATVEDLVKACVAPRQRAELRHCHQLDYSTSGVLLYALSRKAAAAAQKCFERRETRKEYLALCWGDAPFEAATCELGIAQDPEDGFKMTCGDRDVLWPALGKGADPAAREERKRKRRHSGDALTEVEVVGRGTYLGRRATKLRLRPKTGRRHQLRLHCTALDLPIVGDATYGEGRERDGAPRMMLHARALELPLDGRRLVVSTADPFPADADDVFVPCL